MSKDNLKQLMIIGGGLAGCEAAWQAAIRGVTVTLFEMRPNKMTEAHTSGLLAELVCSNSLGSKVRNRATGLLKEECSLLGSLLIDCAEQNALPAGDALAVDRSLFAEAVTRKIESHPNITINRQEITEIPSGPVIIASGPLTSPSLAESILQISAARQLFFFDAIAPIVTAESINMDIAFRASRYKYENDPHGDYINCPFSEEQYHAFIQALLLARRFELSKNEKVVDKGVQVNQPTFFEACLPIEVMAARNPLVLSFGPMRPTGLRNPHNGERPYAIVQLRQDDLADTLYNMVGFQTNLLHVEQASVFRMIPGLEKAEFVRFGQMHRNTYINAPEMLDATLQSRSRSDLFFAGQVAGIEGYMGNIAAGLTAGINATRFLQGKPLIEFPQETMIGALLHYISHAAPERFQPMKANFGLLTPLESKQVNKKDRGFIYAKRALRSLTEYLTSNQVVGE